MIDLAPEINLESARLIIEPLHPAHAENIYADVIDERIYEFIPQDPPQSIEALKERFTAWAARRSPDETEAWLNWVMCLRGTNSFVGTLQASVRNDGTAFIAYIVFSKHWKNGYAAEGCQRILDHLFEDYNVSTVFADVDTRNVASIHLLERLGFEQIAFTKDADFFKGGTSDEFRYQLKRLRLP